MSDKDYGIKISPQGQDVQNTADHELIHSSSWIIPKRIFTGTYSNKTDGQDIFIHNLGYVPMFLAWTPQKGVSQGSTYPVSTVRSLSTHPNTHPVINGSKLKAQSSSSPDIDGRYMIFDLDIEQAFIAPIVDQGAVGVEPAVEPDYGIKISLPGKDVNSSDTRDFSVHSNMRSPQVHSVTVGHLNPSDSDPVVINHNLGYPPAVLSYVRRNNGGGTDQGYYSLLAGSGDGYSVSSTSSTATVSVETFGFFDMNYSIIILKDPFRIL